MEGIDPKQLDEVFEKVRHPVPVLLAPDSKQLRANAHGGKGLPWYRPWHHLLYSQEIETVLERFES